MIPKQFLAAGDLSVAIAVYGQESDIIIAARPRHPVEKPVSVDVKDNAVLKGCEFVLLSFFILMMIGLPGVYTHSNPFQ